MTGHVIAVTGGKGGVGKSTTTINLAVSLRLDGHWVAVVDADVEMPNLVEMLSIEGQYTIHDVLSGTAETEQAVVEIGTGFSVIPGDPSLSGYGTIEPERLNTVVDTLAAEYEYVLLDTGAGLSYDDLFPLGLADEIILVSSPDAAAVKNARRTQNFVRRLNRRIRGLVVTKADGEIDESLADQFETEILGVIPEDPAVRHSTAAGQPLELYAPDSPAAQAYRHLEANLTDGVLPPKRTDSKADETAGSAREEQEQSTPDQPKVEGPPVRSDAKAEEPIKPGLITRIVRLVT